MTLYLLISVADPGFSKGEVLRSDTVTFRKIKYYLIEKVHLDDLDLYVITFAVLATSVLL